MQNTPICNIGTANRSGCRAYQPAIFLLPFFLDNFPIDILTVLIGTAVTLKPIMCLTLIIEKFTAFFSIMAISPFRLSRPDPISVT